MKAKKADKEVNPSHLWPSEQPSSERNPLASHSWLSYNLLSRIKGFHSAAGKQHNTRLDNTVQSIASHPHHTLAVRGISPTISSGSSQFAASSTCGHAASHSQSYVLNSHSFKRCAINNVSGRALRWTKSAAIAMC